jgi:hypothetical protein
MATPQIFDKIDTKVAKRIQFYDIKKLYLKNSISNVLKAFSILRQDIGFVTGMEKIAC